MTKQTDNVYMYTTVTTVLLNKHVALLCVHNIAASMSNIERISNDISRRQ